MRLWQLIRASIYSPSFYRSLLAKPFSFSLKYFFLLGIVLAVSFSAFFSFSAIPTLHQLLDSSTGVLVNKFPDDLVIEIAGGEVSINQPVPYRIQFSDELRAQDKNLPANFLVVDIDNEFSVQRFDDYSTSILITKHELIWQAADGQIGIDSLGHAPNMRIDREFISNVVVQFASLGRWLSPLVVFGSFIIFLALYSFQLIFAVFGACIAYFIGRIRKLAIPFPKAYQIALHALTLGMLIEFTFTNGIFTPAVPYLDTIILVVVLSFNLRWKGLGASSEQEPTPFIPTAS